MEIDLSITKPEQLIGKQWTCPMCYEKINISMIGIEHTHLKHWWKLSLQDLFDIQFAEQNLERRIHEIMYRE